MPLADNVIIIPPTIVPKAKSTGPKKVAAYCRVSSRLQERTSLSTQIKYYRKHIKENPEWLYAGVYSDTKTGRNTERPGLQKLLKKCDLGKVDIIIMKSLSRFTRNTLDALTMIRHLKKIGVDVYFENENIHTLDERGEMVISVYAALSQNESFNISENVKWGIEHSVQNTDSKFYNRPCYGYRRSSDGKDLIIVESEAEVVRMIYAMKESGMGYKRIIKELAIRNIPSPEGRPLWSQKTICRILRNEKYKGESVFYKSFMEDYPGKRKRTNNGEHIKYLCNDHHAAIIKKDEKGETDTSERVIISL